MKKVTVKSQGFNGKVDKNGARIYAYVIEVIDERPTGNTINIYNVLMREGDMEKYPNGYILGNGQNGEHCSFEYRAMNGQSAFFAR